MFKGGDIIEYKRFTDDKIKKTMLLSKKDKKKLYVKNFNNFWYLYIDTCEILKINGQDILTDEEKLQNFLNFTNESSKNKPKKKGKDEYHCSLVINSLIKECEDMQFREFDEYFKTKIQNDCRFKTKVDEYKEKFSYISNTPGVYVLLCKEKRIYVGQTFTLLSRIVQHFVGIGSRKTYKYKPIDILRIYNIEECDRDKLLRCERIFYDFYTENYPDYVVMERKTRKIEEIVAWA